MAATPGYRRHTIKSYLTDKREYTLKQVFEAFGSKLPRTYQVKKGYEGNLIDKRIQKGQILRLECISSKDRLSARAITNGSKVRYFSFYEYTSVINSKSEKQGETIFAMMEDKKLPVTVSLKRSQAGVSEATKLQFLNYFDERHLVGNIIHFDFFDPDVIYLPTFLSEIRLVEVIGLKDEPPAAWATFQKKCDRIAASLEYDTQFTRISIAVHKRVQNALVSSETEVKKYIELKEFHDMCMTEDMYEQMAATVKESKFNEEEELTEDRIYEEVAGLYSSCDDSDADDDDPKEKEKDDNNDTADGDVDPSGCVKMSKKIQDEEPKKLDIDQRKPEAILSGTPPEEESIRPPLPPRRYKEGNPPIVNDKPMNVGSKCYINSNFAAVSPVRRSIPDDDSYEDVGGLQNLPIPPKTSSTKDSVPKMAHASIQPSNDTEYEEVGDLENLPVPPKTSSTRDSAPKMAHALRQSNMDMTNARKTCKSESNKEPVKRSMSTDSNTTSSIDTSTSSTKELPPHHVATCLANLANLGASATAMALARKKPYTDRMLEKNNDKEAAVKIKDGTQEATMQSQTIQLHTHKESEQHMELPEVKNEIDVQNLTIDQLCAYLHILKLDKFIETCKQEMIDGIILATMSRNDLMDEFKLSVVEAARLEKFAKHGHLPR